MNKSQIDNVLPELKPDSEPMPVLHGQAPILQKGCCTLPFSSRQDAVSELYNMDCVEGMKHYPDKYFDLAIVDPPYGINESKGKNNNRGSYRVSKYTGTKNTTGACIPSTFFKPKNWDNKKPDPEYFTELMRVSKNQIIWGGNYFIKDLDDTPCIIVWDKVNGDTDFADAELAWSSFKTAVRIFRFTWNGMLQGDMKNKEERIHPTQKPQQLYKWVLKNYAEKGQRILDTHVGSGSSRIACYLNGFDFVGFEIDTEYCQASEKRFINAIAQQRLF